jgi:hypothetical protein
MSRHRTVVELMTLAFDKDGHPIYDDGVQMMNGSGELFFLLHWGLQLTTDKDNKPVSYTVGICQELKTGIICTLLPEQLKVIGTEQP